MMFLAAMGIAAAVQAAGLHRRIALGWHLLKIPMFCKCLNEDNESLWWIELQQIFCNVKLSPRAEFWCWLGQESGVCLLGKLWVNSLIAIWQLSLLQGEVSDFFLQLHGNHLSHLHVHLQHCHLRHDVPHIEGEVSGYYSDGGPWKWWWWWWWWWDSTPLSPRKVVLEQVYWKEKSKGEEEGVEGDGKTLTRKQNLEKTRQDQEKVAKLD